MSSMEEAMKRSAQEDFERHMRMMDTYSMIPISPQSDPDIKELEKADYEARWAKAFRKITLLRIMNRITDKEVGRLVGLMESKDEENWVVCEECINQKFSEL